MNTSTASRSPSASERITKRIAELGGWRGETLARVRELVREADPDVVEEWKWDVPVWSHDGILFTGEAYKSAVKLTFAKGASLKDPARLFTSSLEGKVRRAIDLREGERPNAAAFRALVRAAVALNAGKAKPAVKRASNPAKPAKARAKKAVLLSGGNPQIAKADGDAPVQAYIAAVPGWKRDVARRLDAVIARAVPDVRKAVKWNSPFYGVEGKGWFLSFHVFTKYVKVGFFRGAALRPPPPGESRQKDVRYLDVHEDDELDEKQLASWAKQAAALPGWSGSSAG
jgi:hypothetical protein